MRRIALLLAALFICSGASLPQPTGQYVADFAGVLTQQQVDGLGAALKKLEADSKSKTQVVAILPATLEGLTVEDYANQLFREWKIGQKDTNNGILIVVAPKERKLRLEIGYGLEGAIPDTRAKVIIEKMAGQTRGGKNDWGGAIAVATAELAPLLGAEDAILGAVHNDGFSPLLLILIPVLFGLGGLFLWVIWPRRPETKMSYVPRPGAYAPSYPSTARRASARRSAAAAAAGGYVGSSSSSDSGWSSSSSGSDSGSSGGGFSGGGGDSGGGGASGDA